MWAEKDVVFSKTA